ncbi:UNVERIFIED_CONTAM: hypothetical protein GTU68_005383 [Idotea baltica]|nr:hypothetical protein [Idotea baltica]
MTANNATWFDFDRLQFETGSATLKSSSTEQIKNIAAILEANPTVAIKVGGYTDNTGSAALNQELSAKRAQAVATAIAAQGIDQTRLASEGYGSQHAIASNDTEAGRAMNRRTSVRVTAK